ncbi:DUF397 domain-containing protein [Actinomadura rupiterrae]|uniref:DUF397 domain-containing protein n=1 Tax=Actinomadura rupiterrae TaxID=559627 RepID=UPI0020A2D81A|nr:DUF397 domain-containing protein [Actinomadura rupiterrae]MCP2341545.1 hypothetical protein [Actinomadura rupiterrae]
MTPDIKWRKATRSAGNGGDCVEVASLTGAVAIRDSKDPNGPRLVLTPSSAHEIAAAIKNI